MDISLKQAEDHRKTYEKELEQKNISRIISRYFAKECELSQVPDEEKLATLATEVIGKGESVTIPLSNNEKIEIVPENTDAKKCSCSFHVYDVDNNLKFADAISFRKIGRNMIEVSEQSLKNMPSYMEELRTQNISMKKDEPEQNTEKIVEKEEEKLSPEEIREQEKQKAVSEYHELVNRYHKNPFSLSLEEMEKMVGTVVKYRLDMNDQKKNSRRISIKTENKVNISISAYWNKETRDVQFRYNIRDKENGLHDFDREMITEEIKNAKWVNYTIPEWEKPDPDKNMIKKHFFNQNTIGDKIQEALDMNMKDFAGYPESFISCVKNIIDNGTLEEQTQLYDILISFPGENTDSHFDRVNEIDNIITENQTHNEINHFDILSVIDSTAVSALTNSIIYIEGIKHMPIDDPEFKVFIKEQENEFARSYNICAGENRTELNALLTEITGTDVGILICGIEDRILCEKGPEVTEADIFEDRMDEMVETMEENDKNAQVQEELREAYVNDMTNIVEEEMSENPEPVSEAIYPEEIPFDEVYDFESNMESTCVEEPEMEDSLENVISSAREQAAILNAQNIGHEYDDELEL